MNEGKPREPSAPRSRRAAAAIAALLLAATAPAPAAEPIVYTVRLDVGSHLAVIEAAVPTDGDAEIELMLPVWTPGYYVVEDFASRVEAISAALPDGAALLLERSRPNRWRVTTGTAPLIVVRTTLRCDEASVSLNRVGESYALLNGSGSWLTRVEAEPRPHEVRLELPLAWESVTGLAAAPGGAPHHYRATDYLELVDSPILAGPLRLSDFTVAGVPHVLASAGDDSAWDGERMTAELRRVADATRRFWGFLPFDRYAFLLVFREGGGGLEHRASTMVTANPERAGTPEGHDRLLGLIAHEYFHSWNAKRLRPAELDAPDLESPPQLSTLWFTEGATSYGTALVLRRAGLRSQEDLLASLSRQIAQLQEAPGRLRQTLAESSREVWSNSLSGINPNENTVSYYVKGQLVAFLLDVRIRRSSGGRRSFDDFMRLAEQRFGRGHGFTADDLRATAEEVAGTALGDWFDRAITSTAELDYAEAVDWLGLRFSGPPGSPTEWTLEPLPDASPEQRQRLADWWRADP